MTSGLVYIFDVDGTLTAEPYVNDDVRGLTPNYPILEIALSLASRSNKKIAVVTARPSYLQGATREWLYQNGLHPKVLLTRKPGDIRPDREVRADQVQDVINLFGKNVVLLDDNVGNCIYVREKIGIPYIHVRGYDTTN